MRRNWKKPFWCILGDLEHPEKAYSSCSWLSLSVPDHVSGEWLFEPNCDSGRTALFASQRNCLSLPFWSLGGSRNCKDVVPEPCHRSGVGCHWILPRWRRLKYLCCPDGVEPGTQSHNDLHLHISSYGQVRYSKKNVAGEIQAKAEEAMFTVGLFQEWHLCGFGCWAPWWQEMTLTLRFLLKMSCSHCYSSFSPWYQDCCWVKMSFIFEVHSQLCLSNEESSCQNCSGTLVWFGKHTCAPRIPSRGIAFMVFGHEAGIRTWILRPSLGKDIDSSYAETFPWPRNCVS